MPKEVNVDLIISAGGHIRLKDAKIIGRQLDEERPDAFSTESVAIAKKDRFSKPNPDHPTFGVFLRSLLRELNNRDIIFHRLEYHPLETAKFHQKVIALQNNQIDQANAAYLGGDPEKAIQIADHRAELLGKMQPNREMQFPVNLMDARKELPVLYPHLQNAQRIKYFLRVGGDHRYLAALLGRLKKRGINVRLISDISPFIPSHSHIAENQWRLGKNPSLKSRAYKSALARSLIEPFAFHSILKISPQLNSSAIGAAASLLIKELSLEEIIEIGKNKPKTQDKLVSLLKQKLADKGIEFPKTEKHVRDFLHQRNIKFLE